MGRSSRRLWESVARVQVPFSAAKNFTRFGPLRHNGEMRQALLVVALAACGGGEDDLTCEYLASPTNCWASAAAELAACLPPNTMPGVFSADRTSCDFANGAHVQFDEALPEDVFDLDKLGFTVSLNGETCGRFIDTFGNRMELTGSGETIVSELHPGREFHLHCDGTTYVSSFDLLFECAGMSIPAPTDGFDVTPTDVTFTITSVSTPSPLFTCVQ